MKCPKCGATLIEPKGVTYGGKLSYHCIVCGNKAWLYKQD